MSYMFCFPYAVDFGEGKDMKKVHVDVEYDKDQLINVYLYDPKNWKSIDQKDVPFEEMCEVLDEAKHWLYMLAEDNQYTQSGGYEKYFGNIFDAINKVEEHRSLQNGKKESGRRDQRNTRKANDTADKKESGRNHPNRRFAAFGK